MLWYAVQTTSLSRDVPEVACDAHNIRGTPMRLLIHLKALHNGISALQTQAGYKSWLDLTAQTRRLALMHLTCDVNSNDNDDSVRDTLCCQARQ